MRIWKAFTEHPASVGETYLQHMAAAFRFGAIMFGAAFVCVVHGVLPFFFVTRASSTVGGLYDRMVLNRRSVERKDAASDRA